jgi:hypothetical protein
MNTKLIMTANAIFLGAIGIGLTFFPREIAGLSGISSGKQFQLVLQIMGAHYISFAMLNWMAKGAIIGGIYNKPIAMANFTHFFIVTLALIKFMMVNGFLADIAWAAGFYLIFTIWFGAVVFRHPAERK